MTSQTWKQRWNQHISKSRSSKGGRWHFPNAIRKYGKDAFSHEVFEVCDTLEEGNTAEKKWISHFDSRNSEKGFNLAKGGQHIPHPVKNPWDRPEYRAKVIATMKARLSDPLVRERMSLTSKEVHSRPEVRAKMSLASKDMWGREDYVRKQREWIHSDEFKVACCDGLIAGASILRVRTHCCNGHEFTPDNTRLRPKDGARICRACHRDRCRRSKQNESEERAESRKRRVREYMRKKRSSVYAG